MKVNAYKSSGLFMKMLSFLVIMGLSTLYSSFELIDSFGFSSATLATLWGGYGKVIVHPFNASVGFFEGNMNSHSYRPLSHLCILIYSLISGLSIERIIFMPISILLIALVLFVLLREYGASEMLIVFTISVGIVLNNVTTMSSTFYYISIGYALAFLGIYLLLKLASSNSPSRSTIITLLLLSVTAPWFYYTFAFVIIVAMFFFVLQQYSTTKKTSLSTLRNIVVHLFLIGVITFASEQTMYQYINMAGIKLFFMGIINLIETVLPIIFREGSYEQYKPVFVHYGKIADISNRIFLLSLFALALITVILIKIYKKLPFIDIITGNDGGNRKNLNLRVFLVVSVLHFIVYTAAYEINLGMLWVYLSLFIAYWVTKILNTGYISKAIRVLILVLILLTLTSGYTRQLIFAVDNTYSNFFSKRDIAISFIVQSLNDICDVTDNINIYLVHHAYAYLVYKRANLPNYDCNNIKYHLISPQLKYEDVRTLNTFAPLIYLHHTDIPYIRIGVLGVRENILLSIIENHAMYKNIIFNDEYNAILYLPIGSMI